MIQTTSSGYFSRQFFGVEVCWLATHCHFPPGIFTQSKGFLRISTGLGRTREGISAG